jgi:5-methylcytosine-specific restriction protein A
MGRVNTGPTSEMRLLLLNRANYACERCGQRLQQASVHHRRPRRMGGSKAPDTNMAQNLLVICGTGTTGCHGEIESNRHAALADGYLLYARDNPLEHPVNLHDGWWWLAEDGTKMRNRPPVG